MSIARPETQKEYTEGYNAYHEDNHKNPFANLSMKFHNQMVYWQMGYAFAELEFIGSQPEPPTSL